MDNYQEALQKGCTMLRACDGMYHRIIDKRFRDLHKRLVEVQVRKRRLSEQELLAIEGSVSVDITKRWLLA